VLTRIPPERFNIDAFYHPDGSHHGKTNVQHAYLLSGDSHAFDASFFNIKPHEVDCIDPQQRMLLETVYDSLAAAGLRVEDLQDTNTAAYVGVMSADYADILYHDINSAPTYTATGSARSIISNRLSYFFNWHGPSMTVRPCPHLLLIAVSDLWD
jgi:hybrid polyketide synthase/nonribosomal peptide synthetase ACE1